MDNGAERGALAIESRDADFLHDHGSSAERLGVARWVQGRSRFVPENTRNSMDRWCLSLAVAKAACVNSQGMGGSRR